MPQKLIIANWKMNPTSESEAIRLAKATDARNIVIAPPFVFLSGVGRVIKKALLGAQDVFWAAPKGAFTGEIAASQLKSLGVKHVIIGHSERRRLGETNETINKKVKTALKAGLKVVLCVGEPWQIRRNGLGAAKNFVKNQLQKDLKGLTQNSQLITHNLLIAYEPIWAIGTGRADRPSDTVEMAKFIKELLVKGYPDCKAIEDPRQSRDKLKVKVLYGGSVTSKNIGAFMKYREIDGALVGGASLRPKEFRKIIKYSSRIR